MKVYIDRASDVYYSSFYIQGLQDCFGARNLKFSNKYFGAFNHNNNFFAVVFKDKTVVKKVIIDFGDSSIIDEIALDWADVYAKINLDFKEPNTSNKIVSIGPSFGIKLFNSNKTIWFAFINLLLAFKRIPNKKRFLSDYKAQFYRTILSNYYPSKVKKNYVYFVASLWKKENNTNRYRANFINACLGLNFIDFDGGFAPRTKNDMEAYKAITMPVRESFAAYVNKTKESMFVFNTPAVLSCHGWKLAEFLCFGKVIISTQISRQLPTSLIDGFHFIGTNGDEKDISKKITALNNDPEKFLHLRNNARTYFETQLAPVSVVKRISSFLDINLK